MEYIKRSYIRRYQYKLNLGGIKEELPISTNSASPWQGIFWPFNLLNNSENLNCKWSYYFHFITLNEKPEILQLEFYKKKEIEKSALANVENRQVFKSLNLTIRCSVPCHYILVTWMTHLCFPRIISIRKEMCCTFSITLEVQVTKSTSFKKYNVSMGKIKIL